MTPQDEKALVAAPQQTETKAVTKFTAEHGKEVGLPSPEAVNYMMSVANLLLNSSLITGDMGTTPEKIKANALAKMLVGNEMHMQPMEALQDIDIVKGKIFIRYPQLINQLILRGFTLKWIERTHTKAALEVTDPTGIMGVEVFEFSIEDAKMAGLLYGGNDSQYSKRPRVMLTARVVSEAYRSTGGRSNVYTPEEKQEIFASEPESQDSAAEPEKQFRVGRKTKQSPVEVSSEPPLEGEGVPSVGAESPSHNAVIGQGIAEALNRGEDPTGRRVQNSDKPPFDPTPQSEPPLIKTVAKPDSASVIPMMSIPDAKVQDFLRGFLNVTKVPKSHPNLLAALEYLASLDPLVVLRDPYALGVDLRDYMHDKPLYCEKMWPSDLRAFLRVLARGGFKLATRFREAAMEAGQPTKILAEWEEAGMDLNTCLPEDIEAGLAALGPHSTAEPASEGPENLFAKMRP